MLRNMDMLQDGSIALTGRIIVFLNWEAGQQGRGAYYVADVLLYISTVPRYLPYVPRYSTLITRIRISGSM